MNSDPGNHGGAEYDLQFAMRLPNLRLLGLAAGSRGRLICSLRRVCGFFCYWLTLGHD